MTQYFSHSILDRLKGAKSQEEIQALLEEADDFEFAQESTKRRWKRVAKKRKRELEEPE